MKRIFSVLFALLVGIVYSQKQDINLDCIKNDSLSFYDVSCLDCYEKGQLISRKWYGIYLDSKVSDEDNKNYQGIDPKMESDYVVESDYVEGKFKEGKPYNGFFRDYNVSEKEWLIFDFYKEGVRVYQLYNDLIEGMLEGRDIGMDTRTLYKKNIFIDNKVWEGIQIYPELIEWKGARIILVTSFREGKEEKFTLLFAAMHYGELLTISNLENGYYFDSRGRSKIKVTYAPLGRKIELINSKQRVFLTIENEYEEFPEKAKKEKLKEKHFLSYFTIEDSLFIGQMTSDPIEFPNLHKEEGFTTVLVGLLVGLIYQEPYKYTLLDTGKIVSFFENGYWGRGRYLGTIVNEEGKPLHGMDIEEALEKGKYNVSYYEEGKIVNRLKNKTIEELLELNEEEGQIILEE